MTRCGWEVVFEWSAHSSAHFPEDYIITAEREIDGDRVELVAYTPRYRDLTVLLSGKQP